MLYIFTVQGNETGKTLVGVLLTKLNGAIT